MQNADIGSVTKRLVNDAIPFGQTKQCGELVFAGVSIQIEMQSNLLKTNRCVFGDPQGTTKIEIAFSANRRVT